MNKQIVLERIKKMGLIAVIRGPSQELTIKMVEALVAGGVTNIEITYSTPGAIEVVRSLNNKFDEKILLGMGTLTKEHQAQEAKQAGASFIVSPICEKSLVQGMVASGLVVMAGALTPTEIVQAYQCGSDIVKVFPGSLVGPGYIKALKGPFPEIPVMPTGGVSIDNISDWFATGVVAVGVGSELCPSSLVKENKWDEIKDRAKSFVKAVEDSRK
ncbi:MAG TPA: 2-dehydro-3-deoxyphosphogluconate aldolase [Anaerolineaceae bacterium]|nr:2-dehydro-3-deoxyphosphogluconate aldolase [Anaerolineaceae bacterium]